MSSKIIRSLIVILLVFSIGCTRYVKDIQMPEQTLKYAFELITGSNVQGIIHIKQEKSVILNFKWMGSKAVLYLYHPITAKSYSIDLNSDDTFVGEEFAFDVVFIKKLINADPSQLKHYKEGGYEYFSYIENYSELIRICFWRGVIDEIIFFEDDKIYTLKIGYKRKKVKSVELENIFTIKLLENI